MVGEDVVEKGLEIGVHESDEFVFHELVDQCLSRKRARCGGRRLN